MYRYKSLCQKQKYVLLKMEDIAFKELCNTVLNTIEESVVIFDKDLVVKMYNEPFREIFESAQQRLTAKETIGMNLAEVFTDIRRIRHHIERTINTGEKDRFYAFCPLHQKLTHYTMTKCGDNYYAALFYPLSENILEIIKAFRSSKSYVRLILNGCPIPVVTVDDDGNIIEWNKAAEEKFGYSREEMLYKVIVERLFQDDMDIFWEALYDKSVNQPNDQETTWTAMDVIATKKDGTKLDSHIVLAKSKYEGLMIHNIYFNT